MKLIAPESRAASVSRGPALSARARDAAIEKEKARYILLACDHYTTNENIMLHSHLCPGKGKLWCEVCGRWVKKAPKPVYPTSDVPLF